MDSKISILGIDPGLTGALVSLKGNSFEFHLMPLKNGEVDFFAIREILKEHRNSNVFLERAVPMAMGMAGAFSYGRGFAALEIALQIGGHSTTYVEPSKWAKEMHAGIDKDLKPKVKSRIAVERLFAKHVSSIPLNRNKAMHGGVIDALLIAAYGQRLIGRSSSDDFY